MFLVYLVLRFAAWPLTPEHRFHGLWFDDVWNESLNVPRIRNTKEKKGASCGVRPRSWPDRP